MCRYPWSVVYFITFRKGLTIRGASTVAICKVPAHRKDIKEKVITLLTSLEMNNSYECIFLLCQTQRKCLPFKKKMFWYQSLYCQTLEFICSKTHISLTPFHTRRKKRVVPFLIELMSFFLPCLSGVMGDGNCCYAFRPSNKAACQAVDSSSGWH